MIHPLERDAVHADVAWLLLAAAADVELDRLTNWYL
jgi:hypothetical protein